MERTATATALGALQPIETELYRLEQDGINFVVRVASNLKRKAQGKLQAQKKRPFDPFLPPEPALTVAEISDSHVVVLNKFNVVEHHLLIVTRQFEDQRRLLSLADFEALWCCLREYPSLAFYNGGEVAGASQPHKHLQLVPLPLYAGNPAFPFEPVFPTAARAEVIKRLPSLPFRHAWCPLPEGIGDDPSRAIGLSHALYHQMLESVGIQRLEAPDGQRQASPYNFLMTEGWMLLVPRSLECSRGISVNGLGYVGSLFVQDSGGFEEIRKQGPMNLLRAVSVPYDGTQDGA